MRFTVRNWQRKLGPGIWKRRNLWVVWIHVKFPHESLTASDEFCNKGSSARSDLNIFWQFNLVLRLNEWESVSDEMPNAPNFGHHLILNFFDVSWKCCKLWFHWHSAPDQTQQTWWSSGKIIGFIIAFPIMAKILPFCVFKLCVDAKMTWLSFYMCSRDNIESLYNFY